jgi:hypothetical protein
MTRFLQQRFTLRALWIFVTIVAIGLGIFSTVRRLRQVEVSALVRLMPTHERRVQGEFDNFVRRQMTRVTSPEFLHQVLQDPQVANLPLVKSHSDPLVWLAQELKTSRPHQAEIVVVSLRLRKYGPHAKDADELVNSIVDHWHRDVIDSTPPVPPNILPRIQVIEQAVADPD